MYNADLRTQDGTLEIPSDAGKGAQGVVTRWMSEIKLADKLEKDWRKDGQRVKEIYRNKHRKANQFNILWANIEVLRPNLYNSTPKPDVRRRFRDADPVGKEVAEVLERALSFEIDTCDFDEVMGGVVFDTVLPGRGVSRIRFEPFYEEVPDETGQMVKTLAGAKTYPELVHWERFRRGSGAVWDDVSWISYEHALTKTELDDKIPGASKKVDYDYVIDGVDKEKAETEPTVFKRVCVYEIWDKSTRKILWIAPSCENEPLLVEDDKLKLQGFFDTPRPVYAIDDTTTLVPIVEYTQYEEQAKELNLITVRINKLTSALKVRGLYDATITEMAALVKGDDNDLIPVMDSTMAMQAGGMDKAIWLMPIDQIAKVLAQLYIQREQVKGVIYEVVGLSDIMRGQSDPNETLGAQELKTTNASIRLQRRQRDIQRYARDVMRIMSEIISEQYTPEFLTMMSGIQVTPQMVQVLRRDLIRGIHVDIQTDSTIAADQSKDRKDVAEIMEAVGSFVQSFGPAVQAGAVSLEAAKTILLSVVRKARMGREVEDALEQDNERQKKLAEQQAGQPPKPTPEEMKLQAEAQIAQGQLQQKAQESQAMVQLKAQESQANQQATQVELQGKAQLAMAQLELERETAAQELQLEREKASEEIQIKQKELALKEMEIERKYALEMQKLEMQKSIEKDRLNMESERSTHEMSIRTKESESKQAAARQEKQLKESKVEAKPEPKENLDLKELSSAIRDVGMAIVNKPIDKKIAIQTDKDGNIKGGTVSG